MRLLITGASGFIGTNAVEHFRDSCTALMNLDIQPPLNPDHRCFWTKTDIMDRDQLKATVCAFAPSHLIHMAARTDCDEQTTVAEGYSVNTTGTENVLAAIGACASIGRTVVVSSQYVCGPGRLPLHDEDFFPHTVYGHSKVITEQLTRAAGLTCVWTLVRPTNVWGPWHVRYAREAWKVIERGLYLHPAGTPVLRSYGYVGNVVWQMEQILNAAPEKVDKAVFYLGDMPGDIREWVDAFSLELRGHRVRCVPRFVLRLIGLIGDAAVLAGVRFPLTSSRVRSMTQAYLTPMRKTFSAFGFPPCTLAQGVSESLRWCKGVSGIHL